MEVLFFVPGDINSASTRLRVLNVIPLLNKDGMTSQVVSMEKWKVPAIPTLISYALLLSYILVRSISVDCVFIHRIRLPGKYMKLLSWSTNVIYDFDDAIHTGQEWKSTDESKVKRFYSMVEYSDGVIAGSPILLEQIEKEPSNSYVLPTSIPREKYAQCKTPKDGDITIGWIGNTENLRFLKNIETELNHILDKYESVSLHIISGRVPEDMFQERLNKDVMFKHWELDKEVEYLSEVDIGIRPLPDNEWTRGKGGYTSVVQLLSLKVPVVVSPVGFLNEMIEHQVNGFLVNDSEEWKETISYLIENEEARDEVGIRGSEILNKYGLYTDTYAKELGSVIKSVCNES